MSVIFDIYPGDEEPYSYSHWKISFEYAGITFELEMGRIPCKDDILTCITKLEDAQTYTLCEGTDGSSLKVEDGKLMLHNGKDFGLSRIIFPKEQVLEQLVWLATQADHRGGPPWRS